jgi:ferredoxin-type protein NapH
MTVKERFFEKQRSRRKRQAGMGSLFVGLLAAGWFYPFIGYFIPLCMVAGVGMAALRGRQWCNWYCPRGSFADAFLALASPKKIIPRWLRSGPARVAVLLFLMLMLTYQIVRLWPDFTAIGGFFVLLLTVTTIAGILLALFLHQRSWCYVCPIGTLSMWVGKNRHRLTLDQEACITCKVCGKVCPMQLAPHEMKEGPVMVNGGDCLKCGLCVAACPKDALSFPR